MKTYGKEDWDIGYSILQTDDNGYIIVGQHYDQGNNESDIYVIRTYSNGDTIWSRIYNSINHDIGYDICKGINSGFVIAGSRMTYPAIYGGGLFVRINDNGDTLWTTTLLGAMFNSVVQASDNGYIAVGTKERGGMNQFSDLCFVKISDSGIIEWIKTYNIDSSPYETYNEGYSVTSVPDGGYIGVGFSMSTHGNLGKKIFMVRTDQHGDSLWTKVVDSIGMGGFVNNFTIHKTPDNGYIIAGGNDWAGGGHLHGDQHIIMVRLGPEIGVREIHPGAAAKPLLSVTPTLFNHQVAIDYQISSFAFGTLNIYDITGRLVRTFMLQADNMRHSIIWCGLNNNGFPVPSGIYYIVLQSGVCEVKQKIILIQ
jgi:hypothetical protein